MKLKEGFILREIAGNTVVIPSGDTMDLNMMITLNGTGAFLWKKLEAETEPQALVDALLEEYEVTQEQAKKSVAKFLEQLKENDFLA
ncbi:MAG: PqqD family protein [Clostridia bacterium]|nr:PqqD family protein [Clostridia bacterium]